MTTTAIDVYVPPRKAAIDWSWPVFLALALLLTILVVLPLA